MYGHPLLSAQYEHTERFKRMAAFAAGVFVGAAALAVLSLLPL